MGGNSAAPSEEPEERGEEEEGAWRCDGWRAGEAEVEVMNMEGRGRGVLARNRIRAGTVVATCLPLVTVPSKDWRHHTCAYCFHTDDNKRLPIRGQQVDNQEGEGGSMTPCAMLRFCSEACRAKSPRTCTALSSLPPSTITTTTLLVTTILTTPHLTASQWSDLWGLCHLDYRRLQGTTLGDEMTQVVEDVCTVVKKGHCSHVPPPPPSPLQQQQEKAVPSTGTVDAGRNGLVWLLAWELLLRLECNVFSYWGQGSYEEQRGVGVFVKAAMFNHSCRPNTAKVLRGRSLVFITMVDVEEGEELCISYIPSDMHSRGERRALLDRHFHFTCICSRCGGDGDGGDDGGRGHDCGGFWVPELSDGDGVGETWFCSLCAKRKGPAAPLPVTALPP